MTGALLRPRRPYMPAAKSDEWCTPMTIVAAVHAAFGGPPDLDPCSNAQSRVGALRSVCLPHNGFNAGWTGKVYVNPPFSEADRWAFRCAQAARTVHADVILLLKAAVDTRRWQQIVGTARVVCFLAGRLTFLGAPNVAPFPVAMVAWNTPGFDAAFRPLGSLWRPA